MKNVNNTTSVGVGSGILCPVVRVTIFLVLIACLARVSFAQGVAYIQSLNPPSATAGSGDVTLTVTGANICENAGAGCPSTNGDAVINFSLGGTTTPLAEVSPCSNETTCQVKIPSSLLINPGVAVITATNPNNIASNPVFFPITTTSGSVGFLNKPYDVGGGPQAIAEGDFNGDGNPDLVIVNSADNTISIMLGDGKGSFQCGGEDPTLPPSPSCPTKATGHNPQAVVVGDFNNDGILDLVVANKNDNSLSFFQGNGTSGKGDGTFKDATIIQTLPGIAPIGLAAVDLNFDGNLDLFVMNQTDQNCTTNNLPNGGSLESLFGNGDGTFSTGSPIPVANVCLNVPPGSIAAGDFNGDAFPDLAITSGSAPAGLVCASGDGAVIVVDGKSIYDATESSLAHPFSTNACAGPNPSGLAAADYNKDNKLDLAVTNTGGKFSILLNAGNDQNGLVVFTAGPGIQASYASYPAGTSGPTSIIAADLNGDGNLDVAIADPGASVVATALGNSDGTFHGGSPSPTSTQISGVTNGRSPIGLVAAPFNLLNGGSRLDLATANHNDTPGTVTLMLQQPQLTILCMTEGQQGAIFGCFGPTHTQPNTPGPPNLLFGKVDMGKTSAPLALLVLNNGGSDIASFPAMDDTQNFLPTQAGAQPFHISTNNCSGTTLPIGQTCEIDVEFIPNGSGDLSATFEIPGIVPGSFENVSVSGTGLEANGTFTPQGLSFNQTYLANAPTGTPLPPPPQLTATLTNTGNEDLKVNTVEVAPGTSDFTLVTPASCVTTLKAADLNTNTPAGSCTVTVSLTPTHIGLVTGQIEFDTDNLGSIFLQLQGQGSAPTVQLSNPPLLFSNQQVGTTSAPQTIVLTNIGNGQLFFGNTTPFALTGAYPGNFAQTNNCPLWPTFLDAFKSCTITVTFTPAQLTPAPEVAARPATLVITDNDSALMSGGLPADTDDTAGLNGVATWPVVSYSVPLSPTVGLNFGGVPFNTTSGAQSFVVSNVGTAPLSITSIVSTNTPEFLIVGDTCPLLPATLAVNTNCTVTVKFTPAADGNRIGAIVVTDNDQGAPTFTTTQTVALSGAGTDFSLSASPTSITISAGKTATYAITLNPNPPGTTMPFTNPVVYSCAGGPPHSNCFISGVSNGSATVILSTSKGVNHGTFPLTFTATYTPAAPAGGPPGASTLSHSAPASITIK